MTASELPPAFIIAAAKIEHYLLNIDHPVGKPKAAFFMRCGFAASRPNELAICLFDHAVSDNLASSVATAHGTKWVFEGPIQAPAGEVPRLRSIWIVRPSATSAELVTAYRY